MTDKSPIEALRPSYERFVDPFRTENDPTSPETNAWESFLVGKNGGTPSMKETHISYLDHFETASNEANLLLGGLSPAKPSVPDRHVRGSGSKNERNNRSRSSSPPRVVSTSTSIASTSKTFSSSSTTFGTFDEETLEEKIARVMSGHYSSVKASATRQSTGVSPERGSPGREREREREREKEKRIDLNTVKGDNSLSSYETISLQVGTEDNAAIGDISLSIPMTSAFEPLTPLPPRLLVEMPKRSIIAMRGSREKEVDLLVSPTLKTDVDLDYQLKADSECESESANMEDGDYGSATKKDHDLVSPISKMMFGSPEGNTDSSPSSTPTFSNMKHSPQVKSTPKDKERGCVTPNPFDESPPMRGSGDSLSPALRRSSHTARKNISGIIPNSNSRSAVKAEREVPQPFSITKRRTSSSANTSINTSLNASCSRGDKLTNLSVTTLSTSLPAPQPSRVVKVAVRVRPFSQLELQSEARRIVSHCADKLVIVNPTAFDADPDTIALAAATVQCKEWAQVFRFNHVLWSHEEGEDEELYVSQEGVHRAVGAEIVNNVLNGVSASCFAYGHTGTGKTYSLFGKHGADWSDRTSRSSSTCRRSKSLLAIDDRDRDRDDSHMDDVLEILDHSGLIPRILYDVIEGMRMQEHDMDESDMRITFSFLEIYNEKIRDLLVTDEEGPSGAKSIPESSSSSNGTTSQSFALKVREHPLLGPYVEGLTKPTVSTAEEALRLLSVGLSRRSTTQTAWNAHSSRSHAVVTLEISHASRYADKAYSGRSIDARSHLFSPTVSFSRSTKNGGGMSPDNHGGDTVLHSVTSLPVHPSTGRDPDHDSRHFVRVQLVDLAGSERDPMQPGKVPREDDELDLMSSAAPPSNSKTPRRSSLGGTSRSNSEAFGGSSSGATSNSSAVNTTEMRMIRRSLSTLGYIIKALGRGEAFKSLPYRDSVLTWLLRDALSGKNHTTMLATLSPAHTCHDESLNTLKYAERLCQVSSKGMQFKGNESSYGFPSSALSSASKDIVQLRHQNSGPSSTGRDGYTYEYGAINSSIHDSLGGNRPGTLAARMLLRRTITDPQQRLAKIGVHKPKYSHGTLNGSGTEPEEHDRQLGFSLDGYDSLYRNQREPSSAFNVTSKTLDNLERLTKEIDRERLEDSVAATAQELEGLKNAYRSLHGQHIEREIELEATRTDRDSLMVELKTAKEAVAQLENGEDGSEPWNRFPGSRLVAAASDMREAVETGERELAELRAIVTRKEAAVDHLLSDLSEEKKARAALERGTQDQAVEFLSRLEKLQRENDSLLAQLSQSMMRSEEVPLALASITAERNLMKDMSDQQQERAAEYLELLEEAATTEGNLKTELKAALADLKSSQERLLLLEGEAGREISRLKVEVAAITRDRDALIAVIDQQEVALQLQNRQSAAAMKALEQRQAALERSEQEAVVAEDELSRLQRGLTDFLAKEGDKMTGEMHDAKRFVRVIAEVRKRLLEADTVHDDLVHERALRLQLQHILDTVPKINPAPSAIPSKEVTRPTHTMATQTVSVGGLSNAHIAHGPQTRSPSAGGSPRLSTSNANSTVNVNINSHSQSHFSRNATPRSHAEVQMRLQTYSNPGSAISSQQTSVLQNSSVVNTTQHKIEAQQMHLHTQQQQQFQQLMEQLDQQRRATEASEQRAQYWQHVAHTEQTKGSPVAGITSTNTTTTNTNRSTSNTNISIIKGNIDDSSTDAVKAENRRLREELEHMAAEALAASADLRNSKALMQKEVWSSKEELRVSREGMQGELASLWMAVQELNKLDAVKEKKMQELLCDRDAASEAKDAALRQLEEMTDNYNELQTELQAIDADLLEAVDAVVDSQHHSTRMSPRSSPGHHGIIGTIMGTKSMIRNSNSEDGHSLDNHHMIVHNGSGSVRQRSSLGPGSSSRDRDRDRDRDDFYASPSTNLPTLPLRTSAGNSPLPGGSSGLNTSTNRSFHSSSSTHSYVQSTSHSQTSRGTPGGSSRGPSQTPNGEARATLGEKILEKQISELSEFLDHDRLRLDSQQKRAKMRSVGSGSQSQGETPRSLASSYG